MKIFFRIAMYCSLIFCANIAFGKPYFQPVDGFTSETNLTLKKFISDTYRITTRKVAVFDADGTLMKEVPHSMDLQKECIYSKAKIEPQKKPDVIKAMQTQSISAVSYVRNGVLFFEGDSPDTVRQLGYECYQKFNYKIFRQMKSLVNLLKRNNFEIWVITASPELLYQRFLSLELNIPSIHIIGIKSVVRNGVITDQIVEPIPQGKGKRESIETFIQEQPLFVVGNAKGDTEMIEYSRGVKMVINPDESTRNGEGESFADFAKTNHWVIERINDN